MKKIKTQREFAKFIHNMLKQISICLDDETIKMWDDFKKVAQIKEIIKIPEEQSFVLLDIEPYDKTLSRIQIDMDGTKYSLLNLRDMGICDIKNDFVGLSDRFINALKR